jgi:hypothetical protein
MTQPSIRKNAPTRLDVGSLHAIIDPINNYNDKIYAAAVWYANNGFMVVPFMDYGYPKGLSQRHASKTLKKIDEWWHPDSGKFKGASIAMAHGGQSGFCAVDLDAKDDVDGMANLADLQVAYGSYDDGEGEGLQTLMASTPSGGRHLVFRYHPEIISNSEEAYPGIDTRGGLKKNPVENGGITFVEPSRSLKKGVDASYRWDKSVSAIIDMPQWLVDVLNGRPVKMPTGIKLQDEYVQSAAGDHGDGRDRNIYMDLMRFVGVGYDEDQLWALMPDILERMDPPDEQMVKRKIESVIQSDAFTKSGDEQKTKKQVSSLDLVVNEKGQPAKSSENLAIILNWAVFDFEFGRVEYDEFSHKFVKDKKPMDSVSNWAVGIGLWISQKLKMDYPVTTIREMVEHIAYSEREHTNIARDYMLNTPRPPELGAEDFWGSGRRGPGPNFKALCVDVLDLNNKKLHAEYTTEVRDAYMAFMWFWLQGVVARSCVPGCKMEIVLNIFGGQGIGKSLFFRELCPDSAWFTDSIQDSIAGGGQNNRDELLKLHAKIIVEMPELNPIKRGGKSGDNKMKQFISAQVDNFRRAYGHDSTDHARTCALCGTSNDNDVYRDSTGARRFVSINHADIPIRVGDQNNGVLRKIRNELWGEVVASFGPGELDESPDNLLVSIPPKLRQHQNNVNTAHKFEEIGIAEIIEWMQDKTRVTWTEIIAFSKQVPGLRDAKESMVMGQVRKDLLHDKMWKLKSGITLTNSQGKTERASRAWVNLGLDIEKNHGAGQPVPPHWSEYSKKQETTEY